MEISTGRGETDSPKWEELLGSQNWQNLLAPLNLSLRQLILRCGDFCQATYDAFNNDQNSKYCGSSRYGKASFFRKVMLEDDTNYSVVSFLYATARVSVPEAILLHSLSRESWDRESNWIGYVAVTADHVSRALGRREIYVAWRGTTRNYEWVNVLGAELESAESLLSPNTNNKHHQLGRNDSSSSSDSENDDESIPKVMRGWLTIYVSDDPKSPFVKSSARVQLLAKIKELRDKYKGEKLSVVMTGHSLGASLSILSAFDLVENEFSDIPVAAFVFGSPQIGNKAFRQRMERHPNLKVLHVRNKIDLIPHYPGRLLGYVDAGTELVIDTRRSPSLKESKNPSDWHNLQGMLHVVAGWSGEEEEFEVKVKRSLALVNKSSGFLKEECLVPESWWVEKNKGMVVDEKSGRWALATPADEDLPVPEY
ncbi:Fungal lipase-like domain containing protein [Parasponia andersonii]|uniref:Phospholipase A1 n=1 Tax=Parasponia andersonii TaxID=3476 RepID=A0A2P5ARZ9_PARAD|nr:Fungal lipase-like domain containing protein [Parasponia andersonii]